MKTTFKKVVMQYCDILGLGMKLIGYYKDGMLVFLFEPSFSFLFVHLQTLKMKASLVFLEDAYLTL